MQTVKIKSQEDLFTEYHAPKGYLSKGFWVRIVAFLVSLVISVYCITQYRCIWKILSYKPITEEMALEKAVEMKTSIATQMTVLSDSSFQKNVAAGTRVKILGAYMYHLTFRNDDINYHHLSPRNYTPSQYFYIELPDGTRGYAALPEALVGRRIVVTQGDNVGDTWVVSSVKKNNSKDKFPFDYYVEGKKKPYHWGEFGCLNNEVEMVVYTCPLLNVPENEMWKETKVPPFLKIPVYMSGGFFLFPRFKSWHAFLIMPIARGIIAIAVWLLLLLIAHKILNGIRFNIGYRVQEKILPNKALSKDEVFKRSMDYFNRHYVVPEFIASCLFSPIAIFLIRLFSIHKNSFRRDICESITMRCPKCCHLVKKKKTNAPPKSIEGPINAIATEKALKEAEKKQSRESTYTSQQAWMADLGKTATVHTHVYDIQPRFIIEEFRYHCDECDSEQCQWEITQILDRKNVDNYIIRDGKKVPVHFVPSKKDEERS